MSSSKEPYLWVSPFLFALCYSSLAWPLKLACPRVLFSPLFPHIRPSRLCVEEDNAAGRRSWERVLKVSTGIIYEEQWRSSSSDNTQGSMFVSVSAGIILTFWKGRDKCKRNHSSLSAAPLFCSSASVSSLYARPVWRSLSKSTDPDTYFATSIHFSQSSVIYTAICDHQGFDFLQHN